MLFEQIRAVEAGVGLLDRRELGGLAVGEVLGVLPDREPGAFELPGELQVPLAARFVPDFAADLVQRVGGEHHDVERVHASLGLGCAFCDRPRDPAGHVGGDQLQCFAALFTQLVKEREHGPAVAARGGPHQPAAVMADHDSEVSLSLAMADLIDPDPPQAVEQIDFAAGLGSDALEDLPD